MTGSLAAFFGAQARFFRAAAEPEQAARALIAEFPGWDPPVSRLAPMASAVHARIGGLLAALYPATRLALPRAPWERLVDAYRELEPAVSYEINAAGERFPDLLRGRREDLDLPPWVADLARLEWTRHAVFVSPVDDPVAPQRLTLNPTAEQVSHPWRLCDYLDQAPPRAAPAPAPDGEVALLWRRSDDHRVWHLAADSRTLLALKIAVEELDLDRVASDTGMALDELRAIVDALVRTGLLHAPDAPDSRGRTGMPPSDRRLACYDEATRGRRKEEA